MPRPNPFLPVALFAAFLASSSAHAEWLSGGTRLTEYRGFVAMPRLAPDGHGGVFAAWEPFTGNAFVTRLTAEGDRPPGWSPTGRFVGGSARGVARNIEVVSDEAGGCYVVWVMEGEFCGNSCFGEPGRIRVQRLLANGDSAPGWPSGGLIVSDDDVAAPRDGIEVAPDGEHGLLIANTRVHRIGPRATREWGHGITVSNASSWRSLLQVVSDGNGGAFAFWNDGDRAAFPWGRVMGQHIGASGRLLWGPAGARLSSYHLLGRGSPAAVPTAGHSAVVGWMSTHPLDQLPTTTDIFAVRVTAVGRGAWIGERVVATSTRAADLRLATEPRGGAILAWRDERNRAGVYAQSLDRNGRPRWRAGGVPVCPGPSDRFQLVLASDGAGGAFVAWGDRASTAQVFSAHVTADGTLAGGWPATGAPLGQAAVESPLSQTIESLTMTQTRRGQAVVAWQDLRFFPGTLLEAETSFAMLLRADGPAALSPAGVTTSAPIAEIIVPASPVFSLRGIVPNPSFTGARVRFTLPEDGNATLETFDVSGRRVDEHRWLARAGPSDVPLAEAKRLPPGVYLVRLSQGRFTATTRAVILP